jgi:hypothetical protein
LCWGKFQLENRNEPPCQGKGFENNQWLARDAVEYRTGTPLDVKREVARRGGSGLLFQRGKWIETVLMSTCVLSNQIIAGVSSR